MTRRQKINAAIAARNAYVTADAIAADACRAAFPVGTFQKFKMGGHTREVEILEWSDGGYDLLRAWVLSDKGRRYTVNAFHFLWYAEANR